jgi:PPK2 family polyphosphate:nucleotide phosphotransferase
MSKQPIQVLPGTHIRLADFDARYDEGLDKETGQAETARLTAELDDLVYRLYAENRRAVLIVLQGMDTSGKDGTIRHVMREVSPQAVRVVSFKQPSAEELSHGFLWRIHRAVPPKGHVGIFNRSQYEDVLVVRVHNLVPEHEWRSRYDRINDFERLLVEGGMTIIKFFLHISNEEQRKRLQARLDDPHKNWKLSESDVAERKLWNDYQQAYEDALTRCNTHHAPWHIVPADRKWYRNLVVSRIVHDTLVKLNPQFPPPAADLSKLKIE